MALREALIQVMDEYPAAVDMPSAGHPVGTLLRKGLPLEIRATLGPRGKDLKVEGSAGQTKWAAVPWAAVFDPAVTESARFGYYPVYLFPVGGRSVVLSFNQGATAVQREFSGRARALKPLQMRAQAIRQRLPEFAKFGFDTATIDLGVEDRKRAKMYEAGHAFGRTYLRNDMPAEESLERDLRHCVNLYLQFTALGAFESFDHSTERYEEERGDAEAAGVDEVRKYALHRRLDRRANRMAVAKAHGTTACQVCSFSYEECYGPLGEGYFEAHHLLPLGQLGDGEIRHYDYRKDFAVLCASCHRMIHRINDPSDLDALRALLS